MARRGHFGLPELGSDVNMERGAVGITCRQFFTTSPSARSKSIMLLWSMISGNKDNSAIFSTNVANGYVAIGATESFLTSGSYDLANISFVPGYLDSFGTGSPID